MVKPYDLELSNSGLGSFLEAMPDALILVDGQGSIVAVNQNLENLTGYSAKELFGQSIEILVPTKGRKKHQLDRQKYSQNPTVRTMKTIGDITLITADQTEIPVDISLGPIQLGEELLVVAAIREMKRWKQVEQALNEGKARLDEAEVISQSGSWNRNLLNDTLTWSKNAYRVFGLEPFSIKPSHSSFMELVYPDDREMVEAAFRGALQGKPYDITHRIADKDGAVCYVRERGDLVYSEDHKPIRFLGTVQDITKQQMREKELLQFRTIMDATPDAISITDYDSMRYVYVNAIGAQRSGYSQEDLLQMGPGDTLGENRQRLKRQFGEVIAAGNKGIIEEAEVITKTGARLPTELRRHALRVGGRWVIISISIDITARIRAGQELRKAHEELEDRVEERTQQLQQAKKEAEEASIAKSEFLANVSHEIRTPMSSVFGYLELLEHTPLNEKQKLYVGIGQQAATSLLEVINGILDFSKIEAGQLSLENIPLDLNKVIEGVISLLEQLASGKGIQLKSSIANDVPKDISGDPLRLRQILINLINNAIKFTSEGEVSVTVSLKEETVDRLCLRFEIKDTGIGIPTEEQAKLFDAFAQEDSSTSRRYGGTGLGLTISKQLAALMGGEIGVNSAKEQGATFWFTAKLGKTNTVALR